MFRLHILNHLHCEWSRMKKALQFTMVLNFWLIDVKRSIPEKWARKIESIFRAFFSICSKYKSWKSFSLFFLWPNVCRCPGAITFANSTYYITIDIVLCSEFNHVNVLFLWLFCIWQPFGSDQKSNRVEVCMDSFDVFHIPKHMT